jgi:hypothetical protein
MDDFEEHLSPRKLSESHTRERGETRLRVGVFDQPLMGTHSILNPFVAFQFLPRTGHSIYYLALTFIEAIIVISLEAAVFGIFFGTKFVYPVQEAFETLHNIR